MPHVTSPRRQFAARQALVSRAFRLHARSLSRFFFHLIDSICEMGCPRMLSFRRRESMLLQRKHGTVSRPKADENMGLRLRSASPLSVQRLSGCRGLESLRQMALSFAATWSTRQALSRESSARKGHSMSLRHQVSPVERGDRPVVRMMINI